MSRIGHKVINIPAGTTVDVNTNVVTVKGPKGELTTTFNPMFTYEINGTELTVKRPNDLKQTKASSCFPWPVPSIGTQHGRRCF